MQILVAGMHRSGTSLLSRLLHGYGLGVGADSDLDPLNWSEENPRGFWEHRGIRQLNIDLMASLKCDWDCVLRWDQGALTQRTLNDFHVRALRIIEHLGQRGSWVAKDPRFSLTAPLWLPHLNGARVLLAIRDPVEVALSLKTRNDFPIDVGLALWELYIRRATQLLHLPRLVVDYGETLAQPHNALDKLGMWLSREPESRNTLLEFIDPSLYRSQSLSGLSEEHSRHPARALYRTILENRDLLPQIDTEISNVSVKSLERHERVVVKLHNHLRKVHRREFDNERHLQANHEQELRSRLNRSLDETATLKEQRSQLLEQLRRMEVRGPTVHGVVQEARAQTETALTECLKERHKSSVSERDLWECVSDAVAPRISRSEALEGRGASRRTSRDLPRWTLGRAVMRSFKKLFSWGKPRHAADDASSQRATTPTTERGVPSSPENVLHTRGNESSLPESSLPPSSLMSQTRRRSIGQVEGLDRVRIVVTVVGNEPDANWVESLSKQRRQPDRLVVVTAKGILDETEPQPKPIGDGQWHLLINGGTRLIRADFIECIEKVLRAEGSGCLRFPTRDYFTGLPTNIVFACSGDRIKDQRPSDCRTLWTNFERSAIHLPNPSLQVSITVGLRIASACRDQNASKRRAALAERELVFQHYLRRRGRDLVYASLAAEAPIGLDSSQALQAWELLCADELEFALFQRREERRAQADTEGRRSGVNTIKDARVLICAEEASLCTQLQVAAMLGAAGVYARATTIDRCGEAISRLDRELCIPLSLAGCQRWDFVLAADGRPLSIHALSHFDAGLTAAIIQPENDFKLVSQALQDTEPALVFVERASLAVQYPRWAPQPLIGSTLRQKFGTLLDVFEDVLLASSAVSPPDHRACEY